MRTPLFFVCLVLLSLSSTGQDVPAMIQGRIDSLVAEKKVPGIFVAVSEDGKRNYYTAGLADKAQGQPFSFQTQVEIGSISKTFTAYVATAVLQKNGIPLDAHLRLWLPDSVSGNDAVANISFRQLMNHTSGLPRLPTNLPLEPFTMQPYKKYGRDELFAYLKTAKVDSNAKYSYSNLGAGLMGDLAASIGGKSYEALVAEYITKPFHMDATGIGLRGDLPMAKGWFDEKTIAEYWDLNALKGAGGIRSTPSDMLTYGEQMLKRKDREPVKTITTQTTSVNERVGVALGWHLATAAGRSPFVWHNGGTYGFSTFLGYDREKRTVVFVVINAFNVNAHSDKLGIEILRKLAGVQ